MAGIYECGPGANQPVSQSDERRKEVKKLVNAEELGRVVLWSSLYSLAAAIPYGHRYATSAVLYTGGVSFK